MNTNKEIDCGSSAKCEVSPIELTSLIALELAVALRPAFLTLAALLGTLPTLLATLTTSALLTLPATSFLSLALTARSLLTTALLTATLIFFTIICHDSSSPVRRLTY
jgi:hypothetical protein